MGVPGVGNRLPAAPGGTGHPLSGVSREAWGQPHGGPATAPHRPWWD